MSISYAIGKAYLGRQIPIFNGGIGRFLFNNIDFNNGTIDAHRLQDPQVWCTYIKDFVFNDSRQTPILINKTYQLNNMTETVNPNHAYSTFMILWIITFFLLICALSLISVIQYWEDKRDIKEIKTLQFLSSRKKRNLITHTKAKRILILFFMCVVVVLWVTFLSFLCTTQYYINSQLTYGNDTNNNPYSSLNNAISISFSYLYSFFNVITNDTGSFINSSLAAINADVESQLSTSIVAFGNDVLGTYNITTLFNTSKTLADSINKIVPSMMFIEHNCQSILSEIDHTKGFVSVYQNNLNTYLKNICSSLGDNQTLQTACNYLLTQNALFKTTIQTSTVSSRGSVILSYLLQQYNINITAITTSFYNLNKTLKVNLKTLVNNTISQSNAPSYLAIVAQTWDRLVGRLIPTFDSTRSYHAVASSFLDTASKYENFIIIFLIFLIFFMILMVLLFSFRDSIQDRSLNRYCNFSIQLLFILVLVLCAFFSIVVLISTNFSQSEICNQVNMTPGIMVLDEMINDKLAIPWRIWSASVAPTFPNLSINLAQPKNILSGIVNRCRNKKVGIFSVLGMSNIINVSQIIRSQTIMDIINRREIEAFNAFFSANPIQVIPQNLTDFLTQTLKYTAYFDGLNYNDGLLELQKPLVGIVNFTGYFNDLSSFVVNASLNLGQTSDLSNLNNSVNVLLSMTTNFTAVQIRVATLTHNLQILQDYRNSSSLLNTVTQILNSLQSSIQNTTQLSSIFSSLYKQIISIKLLNTIDVLVSGSLQVMSSKMVPCRDLSIIFEAMTTSFCSNGSFNVILATFGVLLLMVIVFSQIIFVLVILSISMRLYSEKNVSKC